MKYKYYTVMGNKLKKLRERCSLTELDLSQLLDIKLEDYISYESGCKIPFTFLNLIFSYYEPTVEEVLPSTQDFEVLWIFADGTEGVQDGKRYFKKGTV